MCILDLKNCGRRKLRKIQIFKKDITVLMDVNHKMSLFKLTY